ncbi:MAG: hypothetical protein HY343_08800 [Lentisphaerae bacterium]|nr:hypothetical protein [Lentisphaerota bacterium]
MSFSSTRVVTRNLNWFLKSGVMRPADGFWGVAERLLVVTGNEAIARVNEVFTVQTRLGPDCVVLEHRRADCVMEVAYLFDVAAEVLARPALRRVADNLLDYLFHRSGLRVTESDSPYRDLWGWSNPVHMRCRFWTDDNAWVAALALALAERGREECREVGIAAARRMREHIAAYFENRRVNGPDAPPPPNAMHGLRLNPHWLGLMTLAFAWAARADRETDYASVVREYYRIVLDGPPASDPKSRGRISGLPWTLSEYAYLSLCGSVAASVFRFDEVSRAARAAADLMVQHQQKTGHIPAEHCEAPAGAHLADLIYTQNWATLGLYHAWRVFGDDRYRLALDRSLRLLARLQDRSPEPAFRGCWRGMVDTQAGRWGGGDRYEGGQNSLYTGWTNAPIAWAFLFQAGGGSLLPPTKHTNDTNKDGRLVNTIST